MFLILSPFALTLCQTTYFLLRVQRGEGKGETEGRGVITPDIINLDFLEFARIVNFHVKMLDILVRFYGKTSKSISLYYGTNNIVLFPNRIKGN